MQKYMIKSIRSPGAGRSLASTELHTNKKQYHNELNAVFDKVRKVCITVARTLRHYVASELFVSSKWKIRNGLGPLGKLSWSCHREHLVPLPQRTSFD